MAFKGQGGFLAETGSVAIEVKGVFFFHIRLSPIISSVRRDQM